MKKWLKVKTLKLIPHCLELGNCMNLFKNEIIGKKNERICLKLVCDFKYSIRHLCFSVRQANFFSI